MTDDKQEAVPRRPESVAPPEAAETADGSIRSIWAKEWKDLKESEIEVLEGLGWNRQSWGARRV